MVEGSPPEGAITAPAEADGAAAAGVPEATASPAVSKGWLLDRLSANRLWIAVAGAWAAALLLLLPKVGSFGFWDPQETRLADQAKGLLDRTGPVPPGYLPPLAHRAAVLGGSVDGRPVLQTLIVGWSFKHLGLTDLVGRLPLLLASLFTLVCVFVLAWRHLSRRAAVLSILVLASMPLFLFQARQLMSNAVPTLFATALFTCTLELWLAARRRNGMLMLALAGPVLALLAASALASGVLLGVGVPLIGVGAAALFAAGRSRRLTDRLAAVVIGLVAIVAVVLGTAKIINLQGGVYSFLAGGIPTGARPNGSTFDYFVKQLGFGLFPWCGLLIPAIGAAILGRRSATSASTSATSGTPGATVATDAGSAELLDDGTVLRHAVAAWAVAAFVVGSYWANHCGDLLYTAIPALALAIGDLLAEMLDDRASRTLTALTAIAVVLTVARDINIYPQNLAFVHVFSPPTFPADLRFTMPGFMGGANAWLANPANVLLALAIVFAAAQALELVPAPPTAAAAAGAPSAATGSAWKGRWQRIQALISRVTRPLTARVTVVGAVVGSAVVFGGFLSQVLTPQLSSYFSQREVFEMYHACAAGDEPLAEFQQGSNSAATYYGGGIAMQPLGSVQELMMFLQRPGRVFAIVPADQLPTINETALESKTPMHVVLGRARSLLLSNQLGGKCTQDQNQVSQFLSAVPPNPQHPVSVTWENKLQLVGWDGPDTVQNGTTFPLTMYFKVLERLPPGYGIFMHFDMNSAAVRFQGDHQVCQGKLPTDSWTPGMYVSDTAQIEVGGAVTGGTPAGVYTIYMGFWPWGTDGERWKVTDGKADNANRAILGTLTVQ
jgi:4-amino-4-deoxy-L-arabinose transferase-like glycosyltransferase